MSDPDPSTSGQDRPWSPFPVQDWTTMPPPAPPSWPPPAVDLPPVPPAASTPSWPPPQRPSARPAWLPPLVITLCALLIGCGLFTADRAGRPAAASASRYLPADGAAWFDEHRQQGPGRATTAVTSTESAVIVGTAVAGAVDYDLGGQILGAVGQDAIRRSTFWRTTTTAVGAPLTRAQTNRVHLVGDDLRLLAEWGADPASNYLYRPALVELPRAVRPGTGWHSEGTAGPGVSYRAEFRAAAAEDGCLRVDGTIDYARSSGRVQRMITEVWCPGQGVIRRTDSGSGTSTEDHRIDAPAAPPVQTQDASFTWSPERWSEHRLANTASANTGSGPSPARPPTSGAPSAVPPRMTASQVLLRVNNAGQDVLGFTAASATGWPLRWRAHPGGTVTTLAVFGNVVVAGTSTRSLVGYTDRGVRLWQLSLDEVVLAPPTRASASELAVVTLGGEVAVVDLRSGRVRWRSTPGSDVKVSPVVSNGIVVVADSAGQLVGLDAADGRQRWRENVPAAQLLAATDGRLVVVADGDLFGTDVATGRRLWRAAYPGIEQGVTSFGDWTVLTHGDRATAFDSSGRRVWSRRGVHGLSSDGSHLVCWGRAGAEVIDGSGRKLAEFATAEETAGNPHRFVAGATGVYLLDSFWNFTGWGA